MYGIVIDIYRYYSSLIKMYFFSESPSNALELFHWSHLQLFVVFWKKPTHSSTMFITPYVEIIFFPFQCIFLAIWCMEPIYLKLIQHPDWWDDVRVLKHINTGKSNVNDFKSMMVKLGADLRRADKLNLVGTVWYIAAAYNRYVTNKKESLSNKHNFYQFALKHDIKTIKCILSKEELVLPHGQHLQNKQFIIKNSDGAFGFGTFITTEPKKYLSQIPNIVIQERLFNHISIQKITKNKETLCTFRVATYSSDAALQPVISFRIQTNKDAVTDQDKDGNVLNYIYDKKSSQFAKRILWRPIMEASQNPKDIFKWRFDGLNDFISYVNNIHHKHLNDFVGCGWDITKISNGDWIIVECNVGHGYYFDKPEYSQKILQCYLKKLKKHKV